MVRYEWIALCCAAALLGCGKPAEPSTVTWYADHSDARAEKLSWCADDVERRQILECLNAAAAQARAQLGKMRDEPPLNWNTPDPNKP